MVLKFFYNKILDFCPVLSIFFANMWHFEIVISITQNNCCHDFCSVINILFSFVMWNALILILATSTNSYIFLGSLWYFKPWIELKYPRSSTFKPELFEGWNTNSTFKWSSNAAWRNSQSVGSTCGVVLSC